jgi:hypothetical protein
MAIIRIRTTRTRARRVFAFSLPWSIGSPFRALDANAERCYDFRFSHNYIFVVARRLQWPRLKGPCMPFSRSGRLAAGAIVAVLSASSLWCAAPIDADNSQAPAKTGGVSAKSAAPRPDRATLRALRPGRLAPGGSQQQDDFGVRGLFPGGQGDPGPGRRQPREQRMRRARSFDGDVRLLQHSRAPAVRERPERDEPVPSPVMAASGSLEGAESAIAPPASAVAIGAPVQAAPTPDESFEGLDRSFGDGYPPDAGGDAGPDYYIQAINTSIGIFRKIDGVRVAAFTFDTFMSQGHFGNLCDTDNFGDPIVLYDTFEDRWIITDVAFKMDASGNVVNPPGSFQCIAASKSGDPLAGGWNFYSVNTAGGLGDYPKLGIWPDGLYMSANMFDYAAAGSFQNPRVYAFNKAQMYAGAPVVQVVSFDAPSSDFTILPGNARLQTGTPPAGEPNFFLSSWQFLNALTVYKFHVDWDRTSLSTFTGPDVPVAATSWPSGPFTNAPSLGGNSLDVLAVRAMMQNQYTNIAGVESLWATHTVHRSNATGFAAPRWYQVKVTGGVVAPGIPQAATWDPDGANAMHRFVPSLAVDRAGNMALGYSTSSSTTKPAIKYAGRLSDDPVNTFSLAEQVLVQGTGTQTGSCGDGVCTRWGDYSAMSLDPDGCTFWFTAEYYQADGLNFRTRIGAFSFPACTTVASGALQGTVRTAANAPIAGATVALGSRTATTDASGFYTFPSLPAGTYPSVVASFAGYASQAAAGVAVNQGATTKQDFTLGPGASAACLTDTTQGDFQTGVATGCDLTGSPGDVTLLNPASVNQQNLTVTSAGFGFSATNWAGQTFTPSATGQVTRIDVDLFCNLCTGTTPDVIVSIRATTGATPVPAGPDLGVATISGFSSGSGGFFQAIFAKPVTLTAGTRYAMIFRAVSNPSAGTYAYICSCAGVAGSGLVNSNPYTNGLRVTSANSGLAWVADATQGGRDLGFRVFMKTGFAASGTFVSSTKDANPAQGATATWGLLTWNASVPAGTGLQFQAAASSSESGPFTFVGPDGTAATFFANGTSLAQFNGARYLKYKALLGTTNGGATPILNDVTICFTNVQAATDVSMDPATAPYGGTATLSATLTAAGVGLVGRPIGFTLNGADVGTALTNGVGVATLAGVSLAGIDAGIYPGAVAAAFAGELGYAVSASSNTLSVSQLPQTIDVAPLPDRIATDQPFTLSATGGASGKPVTFSTASTACSVSDATVTLISAGDCAIDADQAGAVNYSAAPRVTRTFTIAAASQTITFPPVAGFSWNGGSATLAASATSGLAVGYSVISGPCQVTGGTLTATAPGTCTVAGDQPGNEKYSAAPQVTVSVEIARAPQTLIFAPLENRTYGDADFLLDARATSDLPVDFSAEGACAVAGRTVHITGAGACDVTASQTGDGRFEPAPSLWQSFSIARAPLTVRADGKVKLLNAPNPALTGIVTGVVNGDRFTDSYATTAAAGSPVGLYPIVPALADPAGRLAHYAVQSLNGTLAIVYAPEGPCLDGPGHQILRPINPNGTSVFRPGSNVPVKFRVCDAAGTSVGTPGVVASFKLIQIVRGTVTTSVSADPAPENPGQGFRFDDEDALWVFHLGTKNLDTGSTYVYRILLADGSAIDFRFTANRKSEQDEKNDDKDHGKDDERQSGKDKEKR